MTEPAGGPMRFSLTCKKCGRNKFTIPENPTDDSPVTCADCGSELARWGDVQTAMDKAASEEGPEAVKDVLRKALGGIDGIRFE